MQSLGSILGIFEIEDQSEDSAYIVNFLASVVKKEYFSHPKRAAIENLEATLHKINLALSELIKQDNTAWLGKLNATLCVFEKNNVHFSVSGKAKTLLIRNGVLNDISDGLTEESNMHPLKTFTEVSSGRLKSNDKVILTTPGLFEIFSPAELQKNAERFSVEKFSQFLKTALVNQLLFGSTLIIDIFAVQGTEPVIKKATPVKESQDIPNAFSQLAFLSKKRPAINPAEASSQETEVAESSPQESEYTDSKTGHIYVQGDVPAIQSNETWVRFQWQVEDICENCASLTKKIWARGLYNIQDFFAQRALLKQAKIIHAAQSSADTSARGESYVTEEASETTLGDYQTEYESLHIPVSQTVPTFQERLQVLTQHMASLKGMTSVMTSVALTGMRFFQKILPRVSVIKTEFSKLSSKHKKYVLIAIASIFIVPFIIIKFQEKTQPVVIPASDQLPQAIQNPLAADKNVHIVSSVQSILPNSSVITTILLKDTLFAITKNSIINIKNPQNTQAFPLPTASGASILHATAMSDLNTIFLLTDTGKLVAFTPSNHVFTESSLSLPDVSHITDMVTYLTYLYILDDKNNTLNRYPRVTGGFGEGTPWLKEAIEIQNTDTIAISEDLYLAQNDHLLAFNRGKQDPIAFEKSATPIIFTKIFTQTNTQFIYALDTTNSRLIQFEKSGGIISQYTHEKIKEASTVTVDEQAKKAYFSTSSEVFTIDLE